MAAHSSTPTTAQDSGHIQAGLGMDIPISDLRAEDLTFRGEGEDHIVLRINNSHNVIRLRKVPVGSSILMTELIERAQRDINFLHDVARPAFGALITDHASLVRLSPGTVQELHEQIKPHRKGLRMHKEINSFGVGCLCPDAALHFIPRSSGSIEHQNKSLRSKSEENDNEKNNILCSSINTDRPPSDNQRPYAKEISSAPLSCSKNKNLNGFAEQNSSYSNADLVCIEIKPKSGIIDISVPDNPFCKFCVKNFLKVETEKETSRSIYCPLDLFSGNKILMQKAIDGLFITPQNNLNVFKNGEPVQNLVEFSHLRDICIAALSYDLSQSWNNSPSEELSPNSALGITLECQKRDILGSFKAHALYNTLIKSMGSQEVVDSCLQSPHALEAYGKQVFSFQNRHQYLLDIHNKRKMSISVLERTYKLNGDATFYENKNHNEKKNKRLKSGEYITSESPVNNVSSSNENGNQERSNKKYIKEDKLSVTANSREEKILKMNRKEMSELSMEKLLELSCEEILLLLQDNLFAMTAKDLSLMLLLRGPHPGPSPVCEPWSSPFVINSPTGWYECQITAVDVISKPVSKILKHKEDISKLLHILEELQEKGEEPICCKTCN